MIKIEAIVRPERVNLDLTALEEAGCTGYNLVTITGAGQQRGGEEGGGGGGGALAGMGRARRVGAVERRGLGGKATLLGEASGNREVPDEPDRQRE